MFCENVEYKSLKYFSMILYLINSYDEWKEITYMSIWYERAQSVQHHCMVDVEGTCMSFLIMLYYDNVII